MISAAGCVVYDDFWTLIQPGFVIELRVKTGGIFGPPPLWHGVPVDISNEKTERRLRSLQAVKPCPGVKDANDSSRPFFSELSAVVNSSEQAGKSQELWRFFNLCCIL
jgi:hypothetical protein